MVDIDRCLFRSNTPYEAHEDSIFSQQINKRKQTQNAIKTHTLARTHTWTHTQTHTHTHTHTQTHTNTHTQSHTHTHK